MQIIFLLFGLFSMMYSQIRLEESFSLKAPFYNLQYSWDTSGSTLATDEFIQLTPDLQSQTGHMWTKEQFHGDFEVHFRFLVGNGRTHGADGLAFWFTEERGHDGILFGNVNKFNGIGVIFDSFDASRWYQVKKFPAVYAIHGTGQQEFEDDSSEGARSVLWKKAVGFRSFDFRENQPETLHGQPVHCIIKYTNGHLIVEVDQNYDSPDLSAHNNYESQGHEWVRLFEVPLDLPKSGYFGFTAATGEQSDLHIIKQILTYGYINQKERGGKKFIGGDKNHLSEPSETHELIEKMQPNDKSFQTMLEEITKSSEQLNNHLHLQFDELKEHIEKVNNKTALSLKALMLNVNRMYKQLSASKSSSEVVKNKLPGLAELVSDLSKKVVRVKDLVVSLSNQAESVHDVHAGIASHLETKSATHSMVFWIFFVFYQLLFALMILFWRLKKKDRQARRY